MTTYMNLEKYEGEEDTSHPLDRGLEISLTIPDQEEVDDGMKPWVSVDALRLLREAQRQSNTDLGTAFYTLDFEKLMESYVEEEGRHGPVFRANAADTLADWLEGWAASLREKYVTEYARLLVDLLASTSETPQDHHQHEQQHGGGDGSPTGSQAPGPAGAGGDSNRENDLRSAT